MVPSPRPTILDGKALADKICKDLRQRTDVLHANGIEPNLAIVTANNDSASKIYVRNKINRCQEIGIDVQHIVCPQLDVETMELVQSLNCPTIVQMPFVSETLKVDDLGKYITAENDVDGFVSSENVAALAMGKTPLNYPCTPLGVVLLLEEYRIPLAGFTVAMIGRSNIVGRPLARMLEQKGATVSVLHSKTNPVAKYRLLRAADIIISATGHINTIDLKLMNDCCYNDPPSYKFDRVFIDVGINRGNDGKLCGDIPQDVKDNSRAYSPVPGGIGPMTVACLMKNTVEVYERRLEA